MPTRTRTSSILSEPKNMPIATPIKAHRHNLAQLRLGVGNYFRDLAKQGRFGRDYREVLASCLGSSYPPLSGAPNQRENQSAKPKVTAIKQHD